MYIDKICVHLPKISGDGNYQYDENPLALNQEYFSNYIADLGELERPNYIIVASSSLYLNPGKVDYRYIEEFLGRAGLGTVPSILICQNQCANAYYAMDIAEKMISTKAATNVLLMIFEWLGGPADRKMPSNEAILSDGIGWGLLSGYSKSGYKIELLDDVVDREIVLVTDPYSKAFANIKAFGRIVERNDAVLKSCGLAFPLFNRSTVEFFLSGKPQILENCVSYPKYEGKHFLSLDIFIHLTRDDVRIDSMLFLLIGVGKFCLIGVSK